MKWFRIQSILVISCVIFAFSGANLMAQDVSAGLKEALKTGLKNAITKVGVEDGYYGNSIIKIPLPEKLQKVHKFLEKVGGEELSESLVKRMNRAAEQAAPQAMDMFVDAVKQMEITDAAKILAGEEHAATSYLRRTTEDGLREKFYPLIQDSMNQVQAIKLYNEMMKKYEKNPFASKIKMDISEYATQKALDGLFTIVAEEEGKIRTDPKARVTDLLKSVFGG